MQDLQYYFSKLGNGYLKSSATAATAFWQKKQLRCRLPLVVYESSTAIAAASECKTAGTAAILKKSQKHKDTLIL